MIPARELTHYRVSVALFLIGLIVSGLSAFPLQLELDFVVRSLGIVDKSPEALSFVEKWLLTVKQSIDVTYEHAPWLGYGTDWLAFGHLVIAMFFVVPMMNPVGHRWVIVTGLAACIGVFPLALICGAIRQIPFWWRLVDCSFGLGGGLLLLYALRCNVFENAAAQDAPQSRS